MLQAGMSQGEVAAHTFSDTETPFQHWWEDRESEMM
jgi:hypothetical protein